MVDAGHDESDGQLLQEGLEVASVDVGVVEDAAEDGVWELLVEALEGQSELVVSCAGFLDDEAFAQWLFVRPDELDDVSVSGHVDADADFCRRHSSSRHEASPVMRSGGGVWAF